MLGFQRGVRVLVVVLLVAQGGNTGQVAYVAAEVEGRGVHVHGILGGQEVVAVDAGNLGGLIGGEEGAVRHIPQGDTGGIGAGIGDGDAVRANLVHGIDIRGRIHDVVDIIGGVIGGGDHGGVDGIAGSPGVVGGHIPVIEHGVAVRILDGAVEGDIQSLNGHVAGDGEGGIQVGGGGDGGGAHAHAGNHALLVHGGDGAVRGGPGHGAVNGGPGLHGGSQGLGGALQHGDIGGGDLHTADLVGGIGPAAAGGLLGDNQAGHLIPQIVVPGVITGSGIDLIEVGVA